MKAVYKALLASLLVVLALGAAYGALRGQPAAVTSQQVVFTNREPVEIQTIIVENSTGGYSYYYEGDGYVLDDIPATQADLDAFIHFMTNCGSLTATRQVTAEETLAPYGLDDPAALVDIQFEGGGQLHLSVGNQEALTGQYYVAADGFPGVYLMAKEQAEPFLLPKTQVLSMRVTPKLAVSSPLSAIRDITFTGGPLQAPITIQATATGGEALKLEALSFGTATHLVRSAGLYQLDQTYGVEILGSLFDIPATAVVGYNLTPADISALGFDTPWMTVAYDMQNGVDAQPQHCVLQLARQPDGACYAMLEGTGVVYQIDPQPFMSLQFEKLPLRWFLTPMLMDVSALTVEGGGRHYRFDLNQADSKNPVVTYQGSPVDTGLFRALFRLATSAANDGAYLGPLPSPTGEPLLTLTYEYQNPAKPADTLALYPGDVRRAQVYVNGVGEFAMKDQFASRMLAACESLLAGTPIEENW